MTSGAAGYVRHRFFKDTNLVVGYRYDIMHGNALNAPPFDANFDQPPRP
jgi:hypothetical protein